MLKIGFLGCGVIGSAISEIHEGFGHKVIRHDLRLNSKLSDLMASDLIFVCLPTPEGKSGSCDLSIIEDELFHLESLGYEKVVVMKSTVPPGTGLQFSKQFSFEYVSCPEFLREHDAKRDYLSQQLHIVGSTHEMPESVIDALAPLKTEIKKLTITEAELVKYFHNTYNAWRITFANAFCDLSDALKVDYSNILNSFCSLNNVSENYLRSSSQFKGFGGPCLPKDTAALSFIAEELKLPSNIWAFMIEENAKRDITLPAGLRAAGYAAS